MIPFYHNLFKIALPRAPSAKTEETVGHRQNNNVKVMGTLPVRSNLRAALITVPTAARSKVTKAVPEKQPLKPEAKDCPHLYESPAPSPSS